MLHPCYTRYTLKNRVNHQYLQALLHPYTLKRENSILSHVASIYVDIVDTMRYHLAVGEREIVMIVPLHRLCAVCNAVVTPERAKDFVTCITHTASTERKLYQVIF